MSWSYGKLGCCSSSVVKDDNPTLCWSALGQNRSDQSSPGAVGSSTRRTDVGGEVALAFRTAHFLWAWAVWWISAAGAPVVSLYSQFGRPMACLSQLRKLSVVSEQCSQYVHPGTAHRKAVRFGSLVSGILTACPPPPPPPNLTCASCKRVKSLGMLASSRTSALGMVPCQLMRRSLESNGVMFS